MEKSRYVLFAIAALTAGLAGVFMQDKKVEKPPIAAVPAAPQPATAPANLITTLTNGQLKQPNGAAFTWQAPTAKPALTIVNFWATWCAPCVEEMPELDRFSKKLAAQTVVGVAIDNPTNVKEFLQKTPVTYPIALAGLEGTDLMRELGNQTGGLPYTVIVDAKGKVLFSKLGKTNEAELAEKLKSLSS